MIKCLCYNYRNESNTSLYNFKNIIVETVMNKSTQVQSMQLHKLLDINEEKKANETKYEVGIFEDV